MTSTESIAAKLDPDFIRLMIEELSGQRGKSKAADMSGTWEGQAEPEAEPLPDPFAPEPSSKSEDIGDAILVEEESPAGQTPLFPEVVVGDRKKGSTSLTGQEAVAPGGRVKIILRVAEPDLPERTVSLTRKPMTIGRGRDADIVLKDAGVSRHHAQVEAGEDCILVRDLHSRNGTMVNDHSIQEHEAFPGDFIRIGRTIIRIHQTKD